MEPTDPQSQTGPRPGPPSDAAGVRSGGRPEAAEDQLDHVDDPDGDELTGAPDPKSEAGGQDSGSMD